MIITLLSSKKCTFLFGQKNNYLLLTLAICILTLKKLSLILNVQHAYIEIMRRQYELFKKY